MGQGWGLKTSWQVLKSNHTTSIDRTKMAGKCTNRKNTYARLNYLLLLNMQICDILVIQQSSCLLKLPNNYRWTLTLGSHTGKLNPTFFSDGVGEGRIFFSNTGFGHSLEKLQEKNKIIYENKGLVNLGMNNTESFTKLVVMLLLG